MSKYLYEEYCSSILKSDINSCLITEIRDVERSDYNSFQNLYRTINPLNAFVLYNNQEDKGKLDNKCMPNAIKLYKNDNNGNATFIMEIINYLNFNSKIKTMFLDVAAINKETLLELLFITRQIIENKIEIKIIYTTPKDYGDYFFDNYRKPYSLSFSPGTQLMENETVLILISGYEEDGELALIRHVNPKKLYIGLAEPSTEEEFKQHNIDNRNEIINKFSRDEGIDINEFKCHGNDIEKCFNELKEIFNKNNYFKNCNVFIAPMNNKLTTIASYLLWEEYQDIQMINITGQRVINSKKELGKNHIYEFKL